MSDDVLSQAYIEAELRGYYPNSRKLTAQIVGEIFHGLRAKKWSAADFDQALQRYRQCDKGCFLPELKDLVKNAPRGTNGKGGDSALWRTFIELVIQHGWDEAIRVVMAYQVDENLRQLLIRTGVERDIPYFGFPDWLAEFCRILHIDGNPAKAYEYAAKNAPDKQRFVQRARIMKQMPIERQRSYFHCLKNRKSTNERALSE